MSTIEERLQALEQENASRKREYELLTIAVNALVSKEAFEKIQEQNSRLFDVLNNHNIFTNERLGDLQNQLVELDGKIVGLQVETRQHFAEQDGKIVGLQTELKLLQTETRQHFAEQDGKIVGLQTETRQHFAEQDGKIVGLQAETRQHFAEQDGKIVGLQAELKGLQTETRQRFTEQATLLQQILARLPEKP